LHDNISEIDKTLIQRADDFENNFTSLNQRLENVKESNFLTENIVLEGL